MVIISRSSSMVDDGTARVFKKNVSEVVLFSFMCLFFGLKSKCSEFDPLPFVPLCKEIRLRK